MTHRDFRHADILAVALYVKAYDAVRTSHAVRDNIFVPRICEPLRYDSSAGTCDPLDHFAVVRVEMINYARRCPSCAHSFGFDHLEFHHFAGTLVFGCRSRCDRDLGIAFAGDLYLVRFRIDHRDFRIAGLIHEIGLSVCL